MLVAPMSATTDGKPVSFLAIFIDQGSVRAISGL
jgi:hypothetical protein